MVGTGANRMPLTKIHPVLLGKQSGTSEGGGSLLAQHRQQHNERMQQRGSPSGPGQMGGNQQYGQPFNQQYNNKPQNMNQQPRHTFPPFNQPPQPPLPFGNNPPLPPQPSQPYPPPPDTKSGDAPKKRKRASRWGGKEDKAIVTGPLTLPANMTEEQRKNYLLQFKIEEITQKLRTGELGIPSDPGERSPSPEPIYNSEGKRLNTREYRLRKRLEEERHTLIKQAVEEIPNYKPPADYKPPAQKISDKVFIPAEKNPAVNFIGLLIGPRGNTLKRLEKETGCKIIIRGKGSVKEGKVGRVPGQLMPGEDEPLHALITGPTAEEVKKGVKVVGDIVKEGIECPDAANELRRNQLRELAELNGTLIDEEIIKCKNCGATDHRHWECQEQKNITAQITCNKCGGYGHVAADCQVKPDSNSGPMQTFSEKAKMDTEYMSLMAELGVEAPPPAKKSTQLLPDPPVEQKFNNNNNMNRNNDSRPNKWGSQTNTTNSGEPKSLMDMNFTARGPGPGNFRGNRPPRGNVNQGAPWMNQNRPFGPRGGGPPLNNPPWQQNQQMRGPPPNFNNSNSNNMAPPLPQPPQQQPTPPQPTSAIGSGYNYQQPPWGQSQTAYPNQQWGQYPGFNQYPQYAPPPPWAQQPPPPPPPPTTSS